jgi:hypothetical protein
MATFHQVFWLKYCIHLSSVIRATCSTHLMLFNLFTLIYGEGYKLWSSSFRSIFCLSSLVSKYSPQYPLPRHLLCPNILLSIHFPDTYCVQIFSSVSTSQTPFVSKYFPQYPLPRQLLCSNILLSIHFPDTYCVQIFSSVSTFQTPFVSKYSPQYSLPRHLLCPNILLSIHFPDTFSASDRFTLMLKHSTDRVLQCPVAAGPRIVFEVQNLDLTFKI